MLPPDDSELRLARFECPDLGYVLSLALWGCLAVWFAVHVARTPDLIFSFDDAISGCILRLRLPKPATPPQHVEPRLAVLQDTAPVPANPWMDPESARRVNAAIDGCETAAKRVQLRLTVQLDRDGHHKEVVAAPNDPIAACVASALGTEPFALSDTKLRFFVDWKRR